MNPFSRCQVDNMMRGGTVIYWWMDTRFTDPGPWTFQAQWGRTVNGPWTDIVVVPVTDGYYTLDPEQHLWGKQLDLYYRVYVTTSRGTFFSDPVRADGGLPRRDWLYAREITRKEYLTLMKGPTGLRGCLLKRRNWGDRCIHSTDHDTAEVTTSRCLECFDIGIVGGYYQPVNFWLGNSPRQQRIKRDDTQGMTADEIFKARAVPYPYVESGDIWVSSETDRRWFVNTVEKAAVIRDKPLVLNLELKLAPASHIIYDYPLGTCGVGGSSSEPTDPCTIGPAQLEDIDFCLPPVPEG